MMKYYDIKLIIGLLFLTFGCGQQDQQGSRIFEAWNSSGSPKRLLGSQYTTELNALPTEGKVTNLPWTDSYWPSYKRGLAWRWQSGTNIAQKPSKSQLLSMSQAQINLLSPAEKYDIYLGNYDYPFTNRELKRTGPQLPRWWGLCHGWAPASYLFKEPKTILVQNSDGIRINFAASDLKALLVFAQQFQRDRKSISFVALRCEDNLENDLRPYKLACRDINPGTFHILLAERIGKQQQPFILDFTQGKEVWNYPVISFKSQILSESDQIYQYAANGTVKIVNIKTTVVYVNPIGPRRNAIGQSNQGQYAQRSYQYDIELDRDGKIIGGEWRSTDSEGHPDFAWSQTPFQFDGYFKGLQNLYQAATE